MKSSKRPIYAKNWQFQVYIAISRWLKVCEGRQYLKTPKWRKSGHTCPSSIFHITMRFATKARKCDIVRVQKRPKISVFATLSFSRQKRLLVPLKPGQWKKHIIPKISGCVRKPCNWQTMKRLFTMDVKAIDFGNSPLQPFLTSNWFFWQMTKMSDKCLLCKY